MDVPTHDLLIVGGGGAGLRAVIAAAEANDHISIGVVSKVYPMRSHTVSAEGGTAAAVREENTDSHAYDTIKGGDFLADQDSVEIFVKGCVEEVTQLEHWGCPWSRDQDGRMSVRTFGGMSVDRTLFCADKTGFHMLHTLYQTALKYDRIAWYDEWFVTSLLQDDGKICGVTALNVRSGGIYAIPAKAVILCTGGAGKLFAFTTNASIKTGDGMALTYRVGGPLKDMEFVQYHPTGLPGTGILITEASRSEGGYLLNSEGERYLSGYTPERMELGPRDMLSRAFIQEQRANRVFEGPYGEYVHLDIRHLGEDVIMERLPFVRELATEYVGIDPVHEPIPVRPVVHYMMGGIHTDSYGKTPVDGLFAAGEGACVSMNGANRLGSNSLSEIIVFGARSGRAAAQYVEGRELPGVDTLDQMAKEEKRRIEEKFLKPNNGNERIANIRRDMQLAMERGIGIYRTEEVMRETCEAIRALQQRFDQVKLDDLSSVFNTELIAALELGYMLDVADALAHSALQREESRGSHAREDFETRDDERFLQHSMAYQTPEGPPRIEYLPVTITRWQPEERKY